MANDDRRLITGATFRLMAQKGARASDFDGMSVLKYGAVSKDAPPGASDGSRLIDFILSNANVDREGDSIDVGGWDLSAYKTNPVVLWAHDHGALPVAKATTTWIDGGQLKARDAFADAALYEFGDVVYRMLKGGFLNACSVGFQPYEWEMSDSGINFQKQGLLEHSVCPVPAHPEALVIARSKGINIAPLRDWAAKTLDMFHAKGDAAAAVRTQLERMRAQADEKVFISLAGIDVPIKRPAYGVAASALRRASTMLQAREKAGARHSASDQALLQDAHDQLVTLGATCTPTADDAPKHLIVDGARLPDVDSLDDVLDSLTEQDVKQILERVIAEQITELVMQQTGKVD